MSVSLVFKEDNYFYSHGDESSDIVKPISLETAIQGDKVMQDFESGSFAMGVDHSQKVKATPIANDYGSKDCVNLSPSIAVSRIRAALPILQGDKPHAQFTLRGTATRLINSFFNHKLGPNRWECARILGYRNLKETFCKWIGSNQSSLDSDKLSFFLHNVLLSDDEQMLKQLLEMPEMRAVILRPLTQHELPITLALKQSIGNPTCKTYEMLLSKIKEWGWPINALVSENNTAVSRMVVRDEACAQEAINRLVKDLPEEVLNALFEQTLVLQHKDPKVWEWLLFSVPQLPQELFQKCVLVLLDLGTPLSPPVITELSLRGDSATIKVIFFHKSIDNEPFCNLMKLIYCSSDPLSAVEAELKNGLLESLTKQHEGNLIEVIKCLFASVNASESALQASIVFVRQAIERGYLTPTDTCRFISSFTQLLPGPFHLFVLPVMEMLPVDNVLFLNEMQNEEFRVSLNWLLSHVNFNKRKIYIKFAFAYRVQAYLIKPNITLNRLLPEDIRLLKWFAASSLNLEMAVQGDKVMQDFELESFAKEVDHSQKVKATSIANDYGSKDGVNLPPSTAISRLNPFPDSNVPGNITTMHSIIAEVMLVENLLQFYVTHEFENEFLQSVLSEFWTALSFSVIRGRPNHLERQKRLQNLSPSNADVRTSNSAFIFSGGLKNHAIVFVIERVSLKHFSFTVVNTGEGTSIVETHDGLKAKARKYSNLTLQHFSDDFFNVLHLSYQHATTMGDLNQILNGFLGSENFVVNAPLHQLQTRDNCTTASLLAALQIRLGEELYSKFNKFLLEKNLSFIRQKLAHPDTIDEVTWVYLLHSFGTENREEILKHLRSWQSAAEQA